MGKRKQHLFFADQRTQDVFDGENVEEIDEVTATRAYEQTYRILRAPSPEAMRHPLSNRLLPHGDKYKIWVSEKWVLEFEWHKREACHIRLVIDQNNY